MANTFKVQYLMEKKVRKGDLLMEVDLQELIKEGYDPTTMVIVTNSSRFKNIITSHKKNNQTRKLASLGDRYEKISRRIFMGRSDSGQSM